MPSLYYSFFSTPCLVLHAFSQISLLSRACHLQVLARLKCEEHLPFVSQLRGVTNVANKWRSNRIFWYLQTRSKKFVSIARSSAQSDRMRITCKKKVFFFFQNQKAGSEQIERKSVQAKKQRKRPQKSNEKRAK